MTGVHDGPFEVIETEGFAQGAAEVDQAPGWDAFYSYLMENLATRPMKIGRYDWSADVHVLSTSGSPQLPALDIIYRVTSDSVILWGCVAAVRPAPDNKLTY